MKVNNLDYWRVILITNFIMIKAFKKKIKLNIMDSKEAEKIFILKKI